MSQSATWDALLIVRDMQQCGDPRAEALMAEVDGEGVVWVQRTCRINARYAPRRGMDWLRWRDTIIVQMHGSSDHLMPTSAAEWAEVMIRAGIQGPPPSAVWTAGRSNYGGSDARGGFAFLDPFRHDQPAYMRAVVERSGDVVRMAHRHRFRQPSIGREMADVVVAAIRDDDP